MRGSDAIRLRNADSKAVDVTGFSNQGADLKISSMSSEFGGITRNDEKRNFPAAQLFRKFDAVSILKHYVKDRHIGIMDA